MLTKSNVMESRAGKLLHKNTSTAMQVAVTYSESQKFTSFSEVVPATHVNALIFSWSLSQVNA